MATPPEHDRLREQLHHLMVLMRHFGPTQEGRDAASGQGRVLRLLQLNSPAAQKELAYVLGIRSQSLAELLAKMEDKGLVERAPHPEDRRTSIVSLTDAGRSAAAALKEDPEPEADPFAVLDDAERAELSRLLSKLIAVAESRMSPDDFPPPPLKWPPPPPPGDPWGPPPPPPPPRSAGPGPRRRP